MNRHFTFRESDRSGAFEQWLRYLGSNLVGGLVNYAVYALLIASLPVFGAGLIEDLKRALKVAEKAA